jgi:hypothetical protein
VLPAVESPVLRTIMPLTPFVPDAAVASSSEPLAVPLPLDEVMLTLPPVDAVEVPALMKTSPPMPAEP